MIWNNCEKIYSDNEFSNQVSSGEDVLHKYIDYVSSIGHNPNFSVWYDIEDKICFGLDQNWTNAPSRDSYFVSGKDSFISGNRWDKKYDLDYYGNVFGKELVCDTEIMYLGLDSLKQVKNSKVLIVGGGPTTKSENWKSDDYDFIFSCNHFFLNEKIKKLNIDLVTVTTEVDLSEKNTSFHEYMKNNSTILCFEDRFTPDQAKDFESTKKQYGDRVMYAHTRYRGKIGSTPRLICVAASMGAKQIDVVGMDGFKRGVSLGQDNEHAFEKGKVWQGTHNYRLYKRHYVALWDYLLNDLGKNIKFRNLGEGHGSNMSTDISKQMFPLRRGDS